MLAVQRAGSSRSGARHCW